MYGLQVTEGPKGEFFAVVTEGGVAISEPMPFSEADAIVNDFRAIAGQSEPQADPYRGFTPSKGRRAATRRSELSGERRANA